ncbi:MAG: hypothetical protein GKR95_18795 [Gammaproteobacteria bacterium]|nr:hypothetical protein [Gammaproteobacteria bacterium]
MKTTTFCVLFLLLPTVCWADSSIGVGFSRVTIDDPMGGNMVVSIWYPSDQKNEVVELGPFEFPGTRNASLAHGQFGLVVLSHGTRGSDLGHRDIAIVLAKSGYVVAAPRHPRDNYQNYSGSGKRIVWEGRPRQVTAVIDFFVGDESWSKSIDEQKIGIFGFSIGGYTALATLGAKPSLSHVIEHCALHENDDPFCDYDGSIDTNEYTDLPINLRDSRICTAVVADPVAVPFPDSAIESMPPISILFYRPEKENVLSAKYHVGRVVDILRNLPDFPNPALKLVKGAHHYSFISPFPESIAARYPEIASDSEEFDRTEFHVSFGQEIIEFFRKEFSGC